MMKNTAIPPIIPSVLSVELAGASVEHSPSLRDEMATEHSASTVISTPVTMIVAPPLTQLSSREMREPLSVSELPPSLARNVTCVGDSGKQANDCLSMMSLLMPHSAHDSVSSSSTALVMSSNFSLVSVLYRIILILYFIPIIYCVKNEREVYIITWIFGCLLLVRSREPHHPDAIENMQLYK